MNSAEAIEKANVIIIKIGSALVADIPNAKLRQEWINSLAQDVQQLHKAGKKIVIVSSGGIAMGRTALGISPKTPPTMIPLEQKQAASSIGQPYVFQGYQEAFSAFDITVAQVLLTMSETENRRMHLNARETLTTLLDNGVIPVINENDTVSTGEIRFGDNDRLAARVGQMINADLVILLSTTDGLYTENPDKNPDAEHISVVEDITEEHEKMAGEAVPGLSTGGMKSKVEAAQAATRAGISLIITKGIENNPIEAIKNTRTTLFKAQKTTNSARKKWIQAHLSPKGSIFIDDGAFKALKSGKSLLPVGVVRIENSFERGDIVNILTPDGANIAKGIAAYSSEQAKLMMAQKKEDVHTLQGYIGRDELIHRNDLVLLIDSSA